MIENLRLFTIVTLLFQKSSLGGVTSLKGLILRHDLLVMLKYKMYKYPEPKTNKDFVERHAVFKTEASQELYLEVILVFWF